MESNDKTGGIAAPQGAPAGNQDQWLQADLAYDREKNAGVPLNNRTQLDRWAELNEVHERLQTWRY